MVGWQMNRNHGMDALGFLGHGMDAQSFLGQNITGIRRNASVIKGMGMNAARARRRSWILDTYLR